MDFEALKIEPMNKSLNTLRNTMKNLQDIDSTAMSMEKEINQSLVNWKASDNNQMDLNLKIVTTLLKDSQVKTAKNSENFKKNLEDFQKTKVSNDLQVAFAKLNDEYGIIQSKSNAEIKSLKICVIILFVALFAITVGIVGFAWKKMMPTNFYQKYNEEVSAS